MEGRTRIANSKRGTIKVKFSLIYFSFKCPAKIVSKFKKREEPA
jgi:hypothetical protein